MESGSLETECGFKSRLGIRVFTCHWLRSSLEIDASRGMVEAAILYDVSFKTYLE